MLVCDLGNLNPPVLSKSIESYTVLVCLANQIASLPRNSLLLGYANILYQFWPIATEKMLVVNCLNDPYYIRIKQPFLALLSFRRVTIFAGFKYLKRAPNVHRCMSIK